jgi:hypothetical protein
VLGQERAPSVIAFGQCLEQLPLPLGGFLAAAERGQG